MTDTTMGRIVQIGMEKDDEGCDVLRAIVHFVDGNAPDLTFGNVWDRAPVRIVRAEAPSARSHLRAALEKARVAFEQIVDEVENLRIKKFCHVADTAIYALVAGRGRPQVMKTFVSPAMRHALAQAQRSQLKLWRRGWAHSKRGPFYERRTVQALVDRGLLRRFTRFGEEFVGERVKSSSGGFLPPR